MVSCVLHCCNYSSGKEADNHVLPARADFLVLIHEARSSGDHRACMQLLPWSCQLRILLPVPASPCSSGVSHLDVTTAAAPQGAGVHLQAAPSSTLYKNAALAAISITAAGPNLRTQCCRSPRGTGPCLKARPEEEVDAVHVAVQGGDAPLGHHHPVVVVYAHHQQHCQHVVALLQRCPAQMRVA